MSGLVKFISGFIVSSFTLVTCLVIYLIFFMESYSFYWLALILPIVIGVGIYFHGKLFNYFVKFYEESDIFNYDEDELEADDDSSLDENNDDMDLEIDHEEDLIQ